VLDIEFLGLIAREGQGQAGEMPMCCPGADLVAILKVACRMLLAKEQPVAAGGSIRLRAQRCGAAQGGEGGGIRA